MSAAETIVMRPDLPPMPERMRDLPLDPQRKVPVPWFVAWVDGEPEFRAADAGKFSKAILQDLCWVCGKRLGAYKSFVLGPMCCITRTTSEPPCHRDCAEWSAQACPFLTKPQMVRRTGNMPEGATEPAGCPIDRNPGVSCIWITRGFKLFNDGEGRPLLKVGDPVEMTFWARGRKAMEEEIRESINSGLPILRKMARQDGPEGIDALIRQVVKFEDLLVDHLLGRPLR